MTRPVTEVLAEFVGTQRADRIPAAVLDRAALSTLDCIAAAVAGVTTLGATSMCQAARRVYGHGPTTPWFTDCRTQPAGAILANCAAASALDIDDGHRGASGHPGAAIVPAVLTLAAGTPWDGPQLLTAITLGYEVAVRVAAGRQRASVNCYAAGQWCGYGVAAALGWLLGLSPTQLAQAMAIAGAEAPQSLPQGACRMGTVKGSSPWGTLTAFVAVERARSGGTGPIDLLDRPAAFNRQQILTGLGEAWCITSTYLKPYSCCRYIHAAVDAMLALMGRDPGSSATIDALTVEIFPEGLMISNDPVPDTLDAAQFSIPFCVALAAVRGTPALRPLTEASLRDPEVLALSRRVKFQAVEEFAGKFPAMTPARVRLRRGGKEMCQAVLHALGDPANPLSPSEVEAKLSDLARSVLPPGSTKAIVDGVTELRSGGSGRLLRALAVPAKEMHALEGRTG